MIEIERLLETIRIGAVELQNRIVMAPMGTNFALHEGEVTDRFIHHYETRAKGGVGLIITEDTTIGPKYITNTVSLAHDRFIEGWLRLTEAVHKHGSKVMPQLIHPAFNASPTLNDGAQPVSASPIPSRAVKAIPRELTAEEIGKIIEQFGEAARRAKEGGCDGVQIHCAHMHHLLGGFLTPYYNKRTDQYGGSLEGRLRLPLEVIRTIRLKVGPGFPILIRISGDEYIPGGRTIEESQYIAPFLIEAGVDAIHVSAGTSGSVHTIPSTGSIQGPNAHLSAAIKRVVDVPVIVVGRITQPWAAENIIATGKADMVALGRALLADPEWPNKVANGAFDDIRPCMGCSKCMTIAVTKGTLGCVINPALGREEDMLLVPAQEPKTVLVVGGGPGGLEAARTAALRGHQVTLMEKSAKLGGQLLLAAFPPMKQEYTQAIQYFANQAIEAGVNIELNMEVTTDIVERHTPDVLIVATGGVPYVPEEIPGIKRENVFTAWDVLSGRVFPGPNVLIIGGNKVGCETADYLAHPVDDMSPFGNKVTILEMMDHVIMDDFTAWRSLLVQRIRKKGVKILTGARVVEILSDGVKCVKEGSEEIIQGMDAVIVAMGTKPNNSLKEAIEAMEIPFLVIGDAKEPRDALDAIREGAEIGRMI